MAIKAVLFDLDNTLYDFSTVHRQALAALAEYGESRFDVPARRFLIAYQEADKQLKRELPHVAACHNRIIICQRMLELLGLPSIVTPLELYETYWGTLLRIMKPRDGAIELLNRLHRPSCPNRHRNRYDCTHPASKNRGAGVCRCLGCHGDQRGSRRGKAKSKNLSRLSA